MERREREGRDLVATARDNDDVNSTKAVGDGAKEDDVDMETMKNLLY